MADEKLTAADIQNLGEPRAALRNNERELIGAGFCPDCGYRGFVLGPRGGAAINIECGNVECRARFNITSHPHNHAFIVFCDRLPKEGEGGATWNEDGGSWSGDHR